MAKYFNSDVSDLAHQLTILPRRLRLSQLDGIDRLLGLIEPDRAYPYDLVCYHVTGYRKRGTGSASSSIPSEALIADLVTMAEAISRKANLSVKELPQPYKTHEELAEQLDVSTKTIRRWRSRGLMGVRAVFEDGVNRVVFLRDTVTRFVEREADLVAHGASFKHLTESERNDIVTRAYAVLSERPMKIHQVARVVAAETDRAIETIRYTLRRHEASGAEPRLFALYGRAALSEEEQRILSCREAGEPIESIARAFDRTPEEVDRVLCRAQVLDWAETPIKYMPNELFDAPDADALILDVEEPCGNKESTTKPPADLPGYLKALYAIPLLTAKQERDLFRRYNYVKHKTTMALDELDPDTASRAQIDAVQGLMERIDAYRRRIIQANLRLVVGIAKRHIGWSGNFFDIVSDGNISLMRAVENFDYARGTKFSTYGSWAIMKNFARSIPEEHYHSKRYVTGQNEVLSDAPDRAEQGVPASDKKRVREIIDEGMSELSEREREIVTDRFGLAGSGASMTLEQLGQRFGVTKERIRQIERRALKRLGEFLSPSLIDALAV